MDGVEVKSGDMIADLYGNYWLFIGVNKYNKILVAQLDDRQMEASAFNGEIKEE